MAAMGLANLGYVVIALVAAAGLVVLLYAQMAKPKRPRLGRTAVAAFVVGLLGLFVWGIFLAGLKEALAQAIRDGESAQDMLQQERLAARLRETPEPNPDAGHLQAVVAMEAAKRNARLFGWDWTEIGPERQTAQRDRPPSNR